MTQQEEFEFRYRLEKERAMSSSSLQQDAPSQPQTRFNLKKESQPYAPYSVGDAMADTGKTIVNNFADVGDATRKIAGQIQQHPFKSAGAVVGSLANAVIHPIQTVKGVGSDLLSKVKNASNKPLDAFLTGGATVLGAKVVASIGKAGVKGMGSGTVVLKEFVKPNPEKLIKKAEKLTTELLNPSKSELATAISQGNQLKAVSETAKIIKKSQNLSQVREGVKAEINNKFKIRNEILQSDNYKIGGDQYISRLKHEIIRQEKLGQATPAEIMQMKQVLAREQAFITKNGGKIDRVNAQARKEYLQDQTERLLVRDAKGVNTSTDPARSRAMDALREGLKEAVEGGDRRVATINSSYDGLKRANKLISEQEALLQRTVPPSLAEQAINLLRDPKNSLIGRLIDSNKNISNKNISNKTSKIEKLMRRAR